MSACHLCPPDLDRCRLCCSTGKWHVSVPLEPYVSKQGASMDRHFAAKQITFEKGGKCGILIKDGTSKSYEGLRGRDSRPFEDMDIAGQVTLKIKWPGYPLWSSNIRTRGDNAPMTLSQLATGVCTKIKQFIDEKEGEQCGNPEWRVGRGHLDEESLVLVSLQRASSGTWEPSIRAELVR